MQDMSISEYERGSKCFRFLVKMVFQIWHGYKCTCPRFVIVEPLLCSAIYASSPCMFFLSISASTVGCQSDPLMLWELDIFSLSLLICSLKHLCISLFLYYCQSSAQTVVVCAIVPFHCNHLHFQHQFESHKQDRA